jgi:hypothetical protein
LVPNGRTPGGTSNGYYPSGVGLGGLGRNGGTPGTSGGSGYAVLVFEINGSFVHTGGAFQPIKKTYVKDEGVWKPVVGTFVNQNGTWNPVDGTFAPNFGTLAGSFGYLSR